MQDAGADMHKPRHWLLLLLVAPFIALLWVPFYNHTEPSVAGLPFFYVWQFGWAVLTALLTFVVFRWWRP